MESIATKRNILLLAAVLGLVTSLATYRFLVAASISRPEPKVTMVVAAQRIMAGTQIKPEMIALRAVPRSHAPAGVCLKKADVVDKVARVDLAPGTPILPTDVVKVPIVVPRGMRAMTVAIDRVTGVAGFLKPGDHVDVLATFDTGQSVVSKTVLQDVQLLALGSQVEKDRESRGFGGAFQVDRDTATLLVTPSEAEQLLLADTRGKLRLVLRPVGEVMTVKTSGISVQTRQPTHGPQRGRAAPGNPSNGPRPTRPPSPPAPPVRPEARMEPTTITVIEGSQTHQRKVLQSKAAPAEQPSDQAPGQSAN